MTPDDPPIDDPLGDAAPDAPPEDGSEAEAEALAREAELVEQTDNGPRPEDGEQDPQLED